LKRSELADAQAHAGSAEVSAWEFDRYATAF
jgi:hypothetical protein